MKKMLKIMAMLLVIGAVVFAAGCSEKKADTNSTASEAVNGQAPVADQNVSVNNTSAEVPAADNITVVNDSANVTDDSANVTDDSANVTDDSANVTDDSANVTDDDSANVTDDSADNNTTQTSSL
ncbi:hypothetical protein [Methanosarcina sp. UBA5]|uniref:hypothetical protein n=1 Tax=Methanosarcina sp. UBA5 TaxID=1915593 RepID=UPI0025CDD7D7|nr:hypothetical protein [Methanosarcina sp. UBA5]